MLTPLFSLYQTTDELTLKLHIPLADLANSEFLIEDGTVYFTAPPYYLRLELPGQVMEDDDHVNFKLESGDMFISMTKAKPGEYFEDLDLLSKLIINPSSTKSSSNCRIQLLDSSAPEGETHYDWFLKPSEEIVNNNESDGNLSKVNIVQFPYGFAASKSGLFHDKPETCLPIDLPNPDFCSPATRHKLQLQSVQDRFQAEHYLADLYEEEEVAANALKQPVPWIVDDATSPEFSDDFRHRLTVLSTHNLPPLPPLPSEYDEKENLKVEDTRMFVYLGLVDLLLAYAYDYRVREGDTNCESGWNLAKLASTLSWLEIFPNLPTLLRTFYERSLSFPLIRNWKLTRKVQSDVATLLQLDNVKAWVLYVLLDIRRLLIEYEGYYIFVDLFLDDYIVWLQTSASAFVLKDLGKALATIKLKKSDVNLGLEEIEQMAIEAIEEEKRILADEFEHISINDR